MFDKLGTGGVMFWVCVVLKQQKIFFSGLIIIFKSQYCKDKEDAQFYSMCCVISMNIEIIMNYLDLYS